MGFPLSSSLLFPHSSQQIHHKLSLQQKFEIQHNSIDPKKGWVSTLSTFEQKKILESTILKCIQYVCELDAQTIACFRLLPLSVLTLKSDGQSWDIQPIQTKKLQFCKNIWFNFGSSHFSCSDPDIWLQFQTPHFRDICFSLPAVDIYCFYLVKEQAKMWCFYSMVKISICKDYIGWFSTKFQCHTLHITISRVSSNYLTYLKYNNKTALRLLERWSADQSRQ